MLTERNKELIRRHYEEIDGRKNFDAVYEQVTEDFFDHEAPERPCGPEALKECLKRIHEAFPDLSLTIEDMIAEGDKVVARNVWRGTHQGEFGGIAATGRKIEISGIVIWRIEGGRIAERWASIDRLALIKQIGGLPEN